MPLPAGDDDAGSGAADEKPFLAALGGRTVSPPPIWLMRQAGRYLPEYRETRQRSKGFLDMCYTPELAVEVTLQPIRRYAFDAAILFSDILVIPDALGQKVEFVEGEGPRLEPIRSAGELAALDPERTVRHLAPVYEAVAGVASALDRQTALIGFAGAPWTVAVYMVEGRGGGECAAARAWAYEDPDSFGRLIEMLVEATVMHLDAQIRAGAEAVQLFDSWAGVLSAGQFDAWSIAPMAEIRRRLGELHPEVPVIGFPRGAGVNLPRYVDGTGVDAVSLDHTVPPAWARDHLPETVTLQGNLDNRALVAGGEALEREVRRIRETFAGRPHVFNLGHGVVPETPVEHVERLVSLVRSA